MTVPTPIVEWAPAQGPFETVDSYANLTGAAGSSVSAPNSGNYYGATTYQVLVRVRATDYTPAATQNLVTLYNATGNQRSWKLSILTSGALQWTRSTNGSTDVSQASSVPTLTNGVNYWLGVQYAAATGAVSFYRAPDSQVAPTVWSGWTLISSHVMTAGAPFATNAQLVLGADDANNDRFVGRIYEMRLIVTAGQVAWFRPDTDGYSGMTSFVSTTAETWTFNGAATLTGDWADLSTDVQSGTVSTGRQYELDRFNAGSATVTWVTDSRLFDFDNSASAYAGQLQPMRQFRIRMRRGAQVWPIFRGYCIDWDQTTDPADRVLFTTVRLGDAFALLDATAAPSPYRAAVLAKPTLGYFRFDDANRIQDSSTYGNDGTWGALATLTTGLLTNDASTAVSMGASSYGSGTCAAPTVSGEFTYEFWISTTTANGTINYVDLGQGLTAHLVAGRLRITRNGLLSVSEYSPVLNDGQRHHVLVQVNGVIMTVAIDGVVQAASGPAYTFIQNPPLGFGRGYWLGFWSASTQSAVVASHDEFAIYNGNAVAGTYSTGIDPWANQTTGARIAAVLDAVGFPAALRELDAGDSIMQAADFGTSTALEAIQQAADTELGQTYVDELGRVHHRSRSAVWLNATSKVSQVTFNDRHSGTTKLYSNADFSMKRDALLLRNPVTAQRANGATVTVQDATLIAEFGNRDYRAPVSWDSTDLVIGDRADFLLSRYKNLNTRLENLTVHVHRDPDDLTATVGTTTIGTRISVNRKPLAVGTTTTITQIVEGVTHQFAPRKWSTSYRASPLETTVYLILDDSNFGQLDQEPLGY